MQIMPQLPHSSNMHHDPPVQAADAAAEQCLLVYSEPCCSYNGGLTCKNPASFISRRSLLWRPGQPGVTTEKKSLKQTAELLRLVYKPVIVFVGLRSYLQRTVQACRRDGYVTTLSGRRRYLPAIEDANVHARAHVCP